MNTIQSPFQLEPGFRPEHRRAAAEGYWQAFARKLRYPLGPQEKAVAFLQRVLDPTHAISAISDTGAFLGVAGFKTPQGAFVGGNFGDLAACYGRLGGAARGLLISALERDCAPDTLLMDGIFVTPAARGQGVGKALLQAIEAKAHALGLARVRLDVIDTNPRARALYEREGFRPAGQMTLGPLKPIFGFAKATEMIKPVRG